MKLLCSLIDERFLPIVLKGLQRASIEKALFGCGRVNSRSYLPPERIERFEINILAMLSRNGAGKNNTRFLREISKVGQRYKYGFYGSIFRDIRVDPYIFVCQKFFIRWRLLLVRFRELNFNILIVWWLYTKKIFLFLYMREKAVLIFFSIV